MYHQSKSIFYNWMQYTLCPSKYRNMCTATYLFDFISLLDLAKRNHNQWHPPKDTAYECNSLVYIFDGNTHKMYKITAFDENPAILHCVKQDRFPIEFPELPNINWSYVGIYQKGAVCTNPVIIHKQAISGKVISVRGLLITCPINILYEK